MRKNVKSPEGVKSVIRGIEGLFEILLLAVVYYLVWLYGYAAVDFPPYLGMGKYVLAGVYILLCTVLFFNYDGFKFGYLKLTDVLICQCISLLIVNFITFWQLCLIANVVITPVPMLVLTVIDFGIALVCCYLYTKIYHRTYTPKNMVMVFGNNEAITLKFKMDTRLDKYRITKLIPAREGFDRICEQIVQYDAVVINDIDATLRNDILKFCYANNIRTYVVPKISDIIIRGGKDINLFDTPLLLVKHHALSLPQRILKRLFDIVVCSVAMIVAAPIMLLVALAIKLEDGGPIFYKQARVTQGGKVFQILKFRSMIVDAEKDGRPILATGSDPRITRVGHFTRATRLDELPQILNILKGDMSIVGPRPERVENVKEFCRDIPEFAFRLKVKGGLTGYAQIYGKYNTSPYDKLRLDMMYIENYSFINDIKLILMTLRIMLKKESTEGFEKVEELEQKKQQIVDDLERDEELVQSGTGK